MVVAGVLVALLVVVLLVAIKTYTRLL